MQYGNYVTYKGNALLMKLPTGAKLELSAVRFGKGLLPTSADPKSQNGLIDYVMPGTSTMPVYSGDATFSLVVEVRNDLDDMPDNGFWISEYEVRAIDPDEGDICLIYSTLGDTPQHIAPFNGIKADIRRFPLSVKLGASPEVTLLYPPLGFMTAEEVLEFCAEDFKHPARTDNPHNVTYEQSGADPAGSAELIVRLSDSIITPAGVKLHLYTTGDVSNFQDPDHPNGGGSSVMEIHKLLSEMSLAITMHNHDGDQTLKLPITSIEGLSLLKLLITEHTHDGDQTHILPMDSVDGLIETLEPLKALTESLEEFTKALHDATEHVDRTDNPHGVTAAQVGASNPNILHNWDFSNPVNQRGQDEYIAASNCSYFIDRWLMSNAQMQATKHNNCMTIDSLQNGFQYSYIYQKIERPQKYVDKVFTLSALVRGDAGNEVRLALYIDSTLAAILENFTCTGDWQYISVTGSTGSIQSEMWFLFYPGFQEGGGSCDVAAVMLEPGEFSTLPYAPPMDFGMALSTCQRYQLRLTANTYYRAVRINNDIIFFAIFLPVTLRIGPILTGGTFVVANLGGADETGFTIDLYNHPCVLIVTARKASHGMSDALLKVDTAAILDANL